MENMILTELVLLLYELVVAVKLISLLRVVVCILARITRVLFVICRRAMHSTPSNILRAYYYYDGSGKWRAGNFALLACLGFILP